MWTKRLRSISETVALAAVLFAASTAQADESAVVRLTAAAPSKTLVAGVTVDRVTIAGLHVKTREDRAPEHGGITLAYADDQNEVRVVVRLAVASDANGARAFAERVMRGVAGTLDASTADEIAFASGDGFVVAVHGNVAYAIDVLGGTTNALDVAETMKRAIALGAPSFTRATIVVAPSIERSGAPIAVSVPAGATYKLRASGAYLSRVRDRAVVHPFEAGAVEVTAIVSDALGRVTETTVKTIAR
jgi:hypothetical protein